MHGGKKRGGGAGEGSGLVCTGPPGTHFGELEHRIYAQWDMTLTSSGQKDAKPSNCFWRLCC